MFLFDDFCCFKYEMIPFRIPIMEYDFNTQTFIDLSITVPSAPGPVILSQSNFAHDNLQIKWTAPVNKVVTRYEVSPDGTTYTTMSSDAMFQFTDKVFVPGHLYVISIITVSGTTSDIVKKSSKHTEWIRTTPASKRNTINYMYSVVHHNQIDMTFFLNQFMWSSFFSV